MTNGRLRGKISFVMAVIFLATALGAAVLSAQGTEAAPGGGIQEAEAVAGPVNFDRAVRLAIQRSPYFTKSSLEIEVKRLDEKDSKYDLVPPVTFRTQYYVNQPKDISNKAYSLNFVSSNYNPVESYFSLQARKMITQIAILAHMQVISEGIRKLAKMFLEMEALQQAAVRQEDLIALARQNLQFLQKRMQLGTVTSLEIKVAEQELAGAQSEKEHIAYSQKRLKDNIQAFIGLKAGQPLELDCKDARRQVVGAFDPAFASLEQVKNHSYELKMAALKKELQKYNILLAKARLLPSFFMGAQTPDPLSSPSRGLFFAVGVELPIWDGFKRLRNVSRQKTILREFEAENTEKGIYLTDQWQEAQENVRSADASRKSAQAQEELARLKERQADIRYNSGGEPLSVYLDGRKGLMDAQKNAFLKALDYDLAIIKLRQLTGDLDASYVDASSWQQ
ncbi:MAG: TolC family protein [Desulfobaccales bacterium]